MQNHVSESKPLEDSTFRARRACCPHPLIGSESHLFDSAGSLQRLYCRWPNHVNPYRAARIQLQDSL